MTTTSLNLFQNFRQKKWRQKVQTIDKESEEQMSSSKDTTVNMTSTSSNDSTLRLQIPAWTKWTDWSSCSKSCGSGTRKRNRTCENGECFGDNEEGEICIKKKCPKKIENAAQFWNAQNSESRSFDFISWPNDPKDCKFFEFRDNRGRKLTRKECLAILDRSANRLYPLSTKECLEKNFYLKDGRKLSNSECIEIVDKREMFIIKSARMILTRDPESKEECSRSDFYFNGKYLSVLECEERIENLTTTESDIQEDVFGFGPRHRKDCEDYEFIVDDKALSVEECLQLLRMSRRND